MSEAPSRARAPRADAARNRERLLAAAKAVFSSGGAEASLEAVARRAGVGIGTLYRHFPTREAIFEAVYRREVDDLATLADELGVGVPADEALRRWVRAIVDFVATKKGMAVALAVAAYNQNLATYSFERLTAALSTLLARARAAGALRTEIGPEDLLRALIGFCIVDDRPGWRASALRLIDIFLDGILRDSEERRSPHGAK